MRQTRPAATRSMRRRATPYIPVEVRPTVGADTSAITSVATAATVGEEGPMVAFMRRHPVAAAIVWLTGPARLSRGPKHVLAPA